MPLATEGAPTVPARHNNILRAVWSRGICLVAVAAAAASGCQWRPWKSASTPPPISGGAVAQASDDSSAADNVAWASASASDGGVQQTPYTPAGDIAPPPLPGGSPAAVNRAATQPRIANQAAPARSNETATLPPPPSSTAWPASTREGETDNLAVVPPVSGGSRSVAPPTSTAASAPPTAQPSWPEEDTARADEPAPNPASESSNAVSWDAPSYRTAARPAAAAGPATEVPPTSREPVAPAQPPLAGQVPADPPPAFNPPATSRYGDAPPISAPLIAAPPVAEPPITGPPVAAPPFAAPVTNAVPAAPRTSSALEGQPNVTPGLEIVAVVGNEVILNRDVVPDVEQILRENAERIPASQVEEIRAQLLERRKKYLIDLIETKQVLVEMRRNVPEEGFTRVLGNVEKKFEEVEVPDLMKRTETGTRVELVKKMAESSNSFDQYKKTWIDKSLATAWVGQKFGDYQGKEPTHEDLWKYYQEHEKDFQFPSKARWQEITVSYGAKRSRQQAWDRLGELWQEVKNGKPFEQVAKESSEGPTASEGGQRDWISQGSHRSETMDQALFTWPVAQLSTGIEDEGAFHIIVVLERRSAGQTPFSEVQADIRDKIKKADRAAKIKEYLEKVRTTVPVRLYEDIEIDLDAPIVPNDE